MSAPSSRSALAAGLVDAGLVAFTLAVGLAASALTYSSLHQAATQQMRDRLTATGQAVIDSFDLDLARAVEAVRGAALMIGAQDSLPRETFSAYGRVLLAHTPALRFLEWQPVVANSQRAAFEAEARRMGLADFRIREPAGDKLVPARERVEYVPILFAAPEQPAVPGLDLAFDSTRMRSKYLARDGGLPVASEIFKIIEQGSLGAGAENDQSGFAITAPVYWSGRALPVSMDERRARLRGYVAGVIRAATLFREAAFRADASQLDLQVSDRGSSARQVVFGARGAGSDIDAAIFSIYQANERDLVMTVDVAGRPWEILLHPRPAFFAAEEKHADKWAAIGGVIATLLLASALARVLRDRRVLRTNQAAVHAAEGALAQERQRLTNILSGTNAGTWDWDLRTGAVDINARWANILGYTPEDLAPMSLERLNELMHPDDNQRVYTVLAHHFSGELPYYETEFRLRRKDGGWTWIASRGRVYEWHADGAPARMAGVHLDIDVRRRADDALQASETRYERLTNQIPVGVFACRILASGRIEYDYVSGQFCRLCGVEARAVLQDPGALFGHIVAEDFNDFLLAHLEGARTLAPLHWEGRLLVDGATRWMQVEAIGSALEEGASSWNGVLTDITERRAAELALVHSEHFLRLLMDVFPGVVSYWTPEQRCTFANAALRDWYGFTPEQAAGMALREVMGESYEKCMLMVEAVLQGHSGHLEREHRRPDGRLVYAWTHFIPDMDGMQVRGFFKVTTDITQVKEAQHALEELNRQLNARTVEAESASVAKSQFLANMSHELRTPMNAILGLLQLLQRTDLSARQLDYATKTESAARSLLGILNDVLDFSKVEAGKMLLERLPFRPDQLFGELAVLLSESVGHKDVEVVFAADPRLPAALVGDPMRLKQVLLNLASNAIKFTPHGEVVIAATLEGTDAAGARLRFSVRDTGIGIAADQQERIFEGFSQAESSTTRRFGGTGLGLAISQRMVELMGGRLQLSSTPGVGSTFEFTVQMPLCAPVDAPAAPQASLPAMLRTLVVDDNASSRAALADMLGAFGWPLQAVASGEDALALLDAAGGFPFDLVLVDWRMAGMDGWQSAEAIRQRRATAGSKAPVILMVTAHGREILLGSLRGAPAKRDGLLVKPVTAGMLRQAVAEALADDGAALRRQVTPAGRARLAGLRILVVEDNPTNRQVAQELLALEGAQVTLAADGQRGVEAVAQAQPPFDLVLMDVQMPGMDGLAATAAIRKDLGQVALPIIAMTANALPSDRADCLAAGMNDHIGKPFDFEQLVGTVLAHAGRSLGRQALPQEAAPAAARPTLPPADDLLDVEAAMRRMQCSPEFYARLAAGYQRDAAELEQRLASPASSAATRLELLHTLKGLASTVGAQALADAARAAETALRAAPGAAHDDLLGIVHDLLARTAAALRAWLPPARALAASGGHQGQALLRLKLGELASLLDSSNMRALDVYHDIVRAHSAQLAEHGAHARTLDEAIGRLDFAVALAAGRSLLQELET